MKEIEFKISVAKWVVHIAGLFLFCELVLKPGHSAFWPAIFGAGLIIYLNHVTGKLLWQIRDYGKDEFERGRRRHEAWSNLQ